MYFCDEMLRRMSGNKRFFSSQEIRQSLFLLVSLDGTEKSHDSIREKGSYAKTKENI